MGFGKELKFAIESRGLTAKEVAYRADISPTTLYSIIQNDGDIKLNNAFAIARVLNCRIEDIFFSDFQVVSHNDNVILSCGERIRKYRLLCDYTQKQLGLKVGFTENTADVRINQYETMKLKPKKDIKDKLAMALNIDVEALSEKITSLEDLMFMLFDMEDNLDMHIEEYGEDVHLVFAKGKSNVLFMDYLRLWIQAKNEYSDKNSAIEYELWKSRFVTNANEHFEKCDELRHKNERRL